jgi:RNA polymerase sigma factor (sigma-70 family)
MILRSDPLASPERLIRRVYAYVAYRIGDGPDAEDVTSETFARALRYRSSYDRSKGEPISWLLGIARRCVDGALVPRQELPGEVPEAADDADLEERTVERLSLAAAMATLTTRDRELIAFRYGADLTARQIAELMEMSTNAVEVALHRALDRLRGALGDADGEEIHADAVRVSPRVAVSLVERRSTMTGETG